LPDSFARNHSKGTGPTTPRQPIQEQGLLTSERGNPRPDGSPVPAPRQHGTSRRRRRNGGLGGDRASGVGAAVSGVVPGRRRWGRRRGTSDLRQQGSEFGDWRRGAGRIGDGEGRARRRAGEGWRLEISMYSDWLYEDYDNVGHARALTGHGPTGGPRSSLRARDVALAGACYSTERRWRVLTMVLDFRVARGTRSRMNWCRQAWIIEFYRLGQDFVTCLGSEVQKIQEKLGGGLIKPLNLRLNTNASVLDYCSLLGCVWYNFDSQWADSIRKVILRRKVIFLLFSSINSST
jgi:hypothetical protein